MEMLEVAIISLKCALRDEEPEFKQFFEARAWEEKKDEVQAPEEAAAGALIVEASDEQLPKEKVDGVEELADLAATDSE